MSNSLSFRRNVLRISHARQQGTTEVQRKKEPSSISAVIGKSPLKPTIKRGEKRLLILSVCYLLSHVQLLVAPWTVTCQAPLSLEFSRQEHWSELPFPFRPDLPDPGIEL